MADAKDCLQFLERGRRLFPNVRLKFGWIKLAPATPARFGDQGVGLGGGEIAVDRTRGNPKTPGSLGLGSTTGNKLHHSFP